MTEGFLIETNVVWNTFCDRGVSVEAVQVRLRPALQ